MKKVDFFPVRHAIYRVEEQFVCLFPVLLLILRIFVCLFVFVSFCFVLSCFDILFLFLCVGCVGVSL